MPTPKIICDKLYEKGTKASLAKRPDTPKGEETPKSKMIEIKSKKCEVKVTTVKQITCDNQESKNKTNLVKKRTELDHSSLGSCPFKPVSSNNNSRSLNTTQIPSHTSKSKPLRTCPFKSMMLNSYSDNRSFSESFHTHSVRGAGCTQNVCKGSVLKDNIIKTGQLKNVEEARRENIEFLNQYYESINKYLF